MIETDTEKADWQADSQNKAKSVEITFLQTSPNTLEKVASQGLEPWITESKSAVLPLHYEAFKAGASAT